MMDSALRHILLPSSSSSSEAADFDPLAKRRKLCPRKVCIPCFCEFADDDYYYYILIVDLNSRRNSNTLDGDKKFIPMAPTLRFKREEVNADGFGLLGSMLYILEADGVESDPPPKSVYTIDLSSYDLTKSDLILEKSELGKVPNMMHAKNNPRATATADGKKFLVFSTVIRFQLFTETAGENDFELYDPEAKEWQQLPGICYDWGSLCHQCPYFCFRINSFTFISVSTFLVQHETGLIFALDLASLDKGWRKCDSLFGGKPIPVPFKTGPFSVIENELCLTNYGIYDIQRGNQLPNWFYFPYTSFGDYNIIFPGISCVTLLDDVNDGNFSFCTLKTGKPGKIRDMGYPHLIINIYNCDLTKYRKDKENMGETVELWTSISTVESFRYVLNAEQCRVFIPINLFSI